MIEEENNEFLDNLRDAKERAEGLYVASLFKNPSLFMEYEMSGKHLSKSSPWAMYYTIFKAMQKRGIEVFDALTMDSYIEENLQEKGKKFYSSYGGFAPIQIMIDIVEDKNILEYYSNVLRYSAIFRLHNEGFDIERYWSAIQNLNYKELSNHFEGMVNDVFNDIDMEEDKVVNLTENLRTTWEEAHKGENAGLPLQSKLLNNIVKGQVTGHITLLGGRSGVGKTYLTIGLTLPTHISQNEPLLIMCNEEDIKNWQMQITVWAANNVVRFRKKYKELDLTLDKSRYFDSQGGFTKQEWELIDDSIAWLNDKIEDESIKFVNFNSFSMDKAIGLIKKYVTQRNFRYFILDTMKMDNDVGSNANDLAWLHLQQGMVKLYNVIKKSNKDAHVWVTYQLKKENRRYLDSESLGMSKNVIDVVSTVILVRNVYEKEKANGSIKVKDKDQKDVLILPDNDYMLCFIAKNRRGGTSDVVVLKTDKNRNIISDIGITKIEEDF